MSFAESYLGKLRAQVGSIPLLVVGARVFIENDRDELLFIKRTDFETWGLIGGAAELGENIISCAKREATEEAGVEVGELECFGVSSSYEDERIEYPNGDIIHAYSIMFRTNNWSGKPKADDYETSEAKFFRLDSLPENMHPTTKKALERYLEFKKTGSFSLS